MRALDPGNGWLLYDGDCALCQALVRRFGAWFSTLGYRCAPLQRPWVARRLGMERKELLRAVRLITRNGRHRAGVDVYLQLLRDHPVTWPAFALLRLPGPYHLARAAYGWVERNRDRVARWFPFGSASATGRSCGLR